MPKYAETSGYPIRGSSDFEGFEAHLRYAPSIVPFPWKLDVLCRQQAFNKVLTTHQSTHHSIKIRLLIVKILSPPDKTIILVVCDLIYYELRGRSHLTGRVLKFRDFQSRSRCMSETARDRGIDYSKLYVLNRITWSPWPKSRNIQLDRWGSWATAVIFDWIVFEPKRYGLALCRTSPNIYTRVGHWLDSSLNWIGLGQKSSLMNFECNFVFVCRTAENYSHRRNSLTLLSMHFNYYRG